MAEQSVKSIVQEFAQDAEKSAEEIAGIVRERLGDAVRTTGKSVASILCGLRKELGVEAVPHRGHSHSGGSSTPQHVTAFLREKMVSGEWFSTKKLVAMVKDELSHEIKPTTVNALRHRLRQAGEPVGSGR